MAARADRADGFCEFVAGSQARMVRLAELLTGDRERAEELARRGYARAYAAWGRIPDGDREAYVRRHIVRAHPGRWRGGWAGRAQRKRGAPAGRGDAAARRQQALRALDRLTRRERLVLVLRCYLGLTDFQTAFELRTSPAAVRAMLGRATAKLGAQARDREDVPA